MNTREIADFLAAELVGDPNIKITGVASLDSAGSSDISFFEKASEFSSSAAAVIVPVNFDLSHSCALLKADDPKLAFTRIAGQLIPREILQGRDETAVVAADCDVRASYIGAFVSIGSGSSVGEEAEVHAGVRIGKNVSIGKSTIIYPNCVIYDGSSIGQNCVIHAGTIIGSDGFGYVKDDGKHRQFPQLGSLMIEDDVEIGANCTIDRGSLGSTIVGSGTKIDNMVHIAHNVKIGKRVLIAGQTGIAGSSVIGDDVILAGQVGISDHVTIEDGAIVGAKSSIFPNKIVKAGYWVGIPAQPHDDYLKEIAHRRGFAKLKIEFDDLMKRMEEKLGRL